MSPLNGMIPERICIQTLIGCVLAYDYMWAHDASPFEIKILGLGLSIDS